MQNNQITIPKKEIAPGIFTTGGVATMPSVNPISNQPNVITPQSLAPQPQLNISGSFVNPSLGSDVISNATTNTTGFDADYQRYLNLTSQPQQESSVMSKLLEDLTGAEQGLTGRGATQIATEDQLGINELNKRRAETTQPRLKSALAEYNSLKTEFEQQSADIEAGAGRKGLTTGAVMGQQGAVDRAKLARLNSKASEIGLIEAEDLALKGQIDEAQKRADRAVELLFADREATYQTKLNQYNRIKDLLGEEDKKRGKALEYALAKEKEKIDEEKSEKKSVQSIMLEAAKNGANQSVLTAIGQAKTLEEALKVGGNALATISTDVIKLDNGNTVIVDKRTGNVINNLGGGKGTNPSVVSRQINGTPVTGYTLIAGDDPYFIAQQYGISVNELKKLNPNVKDWNNIQPGATLNVPQPESEAFLTYLKSTEGGKSLTDTTIQKLDKGLTVLNQLGVLQSNVQDVKTGPLVGAFKSKNPWDTKAQTIKTSLNAIVPNLARGIYGEVGVLTDNDIKTYSKTIPNLTSTEEVRNAVLYITLDMIGKSIKNTLNVNAAAGRDVSGFIDIYTEMENTKNSILSNIPSAQVPQAFQQQDDFLSQFSPSSVNSNISNSAFFNQF